MKCPRCNTKLVISHKHIVEIDYCLNCQGIWLDKGELEKIMEREKAMISPKEYFNDDDDSADDDNDNKYHGNIMLQNFKNRRKRFWADLVDS